MLSCALGSVCGHLGLSLDFVWVGVFFGTIVRTSAQAEPDAVSQCLENECGLRDGVMYSAQIV